MIPREDENPRAVSGHNQPPSPIDGLVAEQREAHTKERRERLCYIVEKANAKDIVDRETAGQAGDIIKIAGEFEKIIEQERVARTKPYRDAADAAKAVCDEFLEPLRDAADQLRRKLDQWSKDEDERIAAQAAEQEAFFNPPAAEPVKPREARDYSAPVEKASPPPPPADLKPARRRKITGDLGARVTVQETKVYNVVDVRAVPDFILQSATVKEAIVQVARSMAKHMPEIAGIEITTKTGSRVQ